MQMIGQLLTGRYLVLKKLGVGGFSETYLARDKYLPHHPLCVVKWLKLSPNSTISQETSQRLFEMEARVLDQLGQHHDQIPTLFAYCQEQDQVYQIQEYIEGENLGSWITQKRCLGSEAAIALLSGVLLVLDFIHSHHVIHRDIKPSNLIQRSRDGKAVLIDFGAACLPSDTKCRTQADDEALFAIGTPGYMPDEQLEGISQFNSDLYALGMSVIHLLTGVNPKQFQPDPISGELDWQTSLSQSIDTKLIAILDQMVRINPRDRYQHASEVLSALEVLPGAPSAEDTRRWSVPRWQPGSANISAALLQSRQKILKPAIAIALVAGLAGGWHYYDLSQPMATMITQLNGMLSRQPEIHMTLLHNLPIQSAIDQMLIAPNNQILVTAGADHVLRFWSLSTGSLLKSLPGRPHTITTLGMSRDSKLLVSGSSDGTVQMWDMGSGELLREFNRQSTAVTAVAISADAQTITSGSKDGTLRLWNLQTGTLLQTLTVPNKVVTAIAYSSTPDRLVSAGDRQLQVWDLRTGQLRRTFAGHTSPILGLQVVDDQTVMSFSKDQTLVWNLQQEELVRVFAGDSTNPITAALNTQRLLSVEDNGSIRVWTRKTGWQGMTIPGKWKNLGAALSLDHRYLVCWSPDRKLRVWQVDGDR
jgi:serine/threonine protein kinase